jgi:hypothetical protein
MIAAIWLLMMLIWLAALLFGLWWIWPHFQRMALTAEFLIGLVWLIIGAAAWIFALNLGLQRYWRR